MTTETIKERMTVDPVTGCWEWNGCKRSGYGRTTAGSRKDGSRRTVSAHRLSYELYKGEIPHGYVICHKCDNPCCINPDHLFAGTVQDNVDDRQRKGRNVVLYGEAQPLAKLTEQSVRQARWERENVGTSFQKLADRYGVNKKTMQNAIYGITWRCVDYMLLSGG